MKKNTFIIFIVLMVTTIIIFFTVFILFVKKLSRTENNAISENQINIISENIINSNNTVNKNVTKNYNNPKETKSSINNYIDNQNLEVYHEPGGSSFSSNAKPMIYIYPTEKMNVRVKLGNPQNLTCTYPKYENDWFVTADRDGTLKDNKTGRNLYGLYWEGKSINKNKSMNEGFCIKGKDTAKFLEEKLEILGLNYREAEEFIIYWLPKMENNTYNYVRFEPIEEQNLEMPLEIIPKPDNIIRIMMDWKALDNKIDVKEQVLQKQSRKGYTVVEWGGSELK